MTNTEPFEGWEMASVGCYWSRSLPDGTSAHLSTWQCGDESGYRLTSHGHSMEFPDLASALAGYDQLANYYGHLFTGADALMGPQNDPKDLGESVSMRTKA